MAPTGSRCRELDDSGQVIPVTGTEPGTGLDPLPPSQTAQLPRSSSGGAVIRSRSLSGLREHQTDDARAVVWDAVRMSGMWLRRGLTVFIVAGLALGLTLAWLYVPSGPKVTGPGAATGLRDGYVDNHYSVWSWLHVGSSFVVKDAVVVVNGKGCKGVVRLVGPPVVGGYFAGVSTGALPGESVAGRRLNPQERPDMDLVLTPSSTGRCGATAVRIATDSWGRTRWTTVPIEFFVGVTHRSGSDARAKESSPPAL